MTFDLTRKVTLLLFNAIIYQLNTALKSRSKGKGLCHDKKLENLRKAQKSTMKDNVNLELIKDTVIKITIIHLTYFLNCVIIWVRATYP